MIDEPDTQPAGRRGRSEMFRREGRRIAAPRASGRRRHAAPSTTRRPQFLLYSTAAVVVVAALSRGQAVLMPFTLAVLLAIILTPAVARLERAGLRRGASVALVLLLVLGGVGAFAYALSRQCTDLANHMPQYSASIKSKLAVLRATRRGPITQIQETVQQAGHDLDKQDLAVHPLAVDAAAPAHRDIQPVVVVPNQPTDAEVLRATWGAFLTPITMAGIVLILLSFMLVQREDLARRLVALAGAGHMTITMRVCEEVTQRINRFLFSQSLINATFGTFIAVGLLLVGMPHALLWGAVAAVLRFVPFLGTTIAMIIPAGLAFLESDGWTRTLETLALFWGVGLVAYVFDPIVNGSRTGTSSFALLVAAIFWTWLWGPVGLLLSTPLTVSLAVLGKHVPELEFLTVVLSDSSSPGSHEPE